jgi:D-glycero-D-manno-heptose 1,7-bisphosphate phosphatase
MLLEAASDHGLDLPRSILVGDRTSDVEAGRNAGVCKTIQIVDWPSALRVCYEGRE